MSDTPNKPMDSDTKTIIALVLIGSFGAALAAGAASNNILVAIGTFFSVACFLLIFCAIGGELENIKEAIKQEE